MSQSYENATEAVLALIRAETWAESKRIVEIQRELLLTDVATHVLDALVRQYTDNKENCDGVAEWYEETNW
jgi:hypothetical protein